MRDQARRRGTIHQSGLALDSVAPHPLTGTADADFGGLGRRRDRPSFLDDPPAQQPAPIQTERSISVKVHPVSSLGLSRLAALSLQGGPDGPTYSGTTTSPRTPPRAHHQAPHRRARSARTAVNAAGDRGSLSLIFRQTRIPGERLA